MEWIFILLNSFVIFIVVEIEKAIRRRPAA